MDPHKLARAGFFSVFCVLSNTVPIIGAATDTGPRWCFRQGIGGQAAVVPRATEEWSG